MGAKLGLARGIGKTVLVILFFIAGCFAIITTQLTGLLLTAIPSRTTAEIRQAWLNTTKSQFIVLLSAIVAFSSSHPIKLRISSDVPQTNLTNRDDFELSMPPYTVVIANHQIYTDWMFLWWIAFRGHLGGSIYIILKKELQNLPVLGFGMKCYDFIFLSRKWETDQVTMGAQLEKMDANARGKGSASGFDMIDGKWQEGNTSKTWPYMLLMYPEGTNLSANTRTKTEIYAAKVGKKHFRHVLLPKTTGLRFSLLKLQGTVQKVYDITVGYSGLKPTEYGQDVYTLGEAFLKGNHPQAVDFHMRSYKIDEIPIGKLCYDDPEEEERDRVKFEDWLFQVWTEKDELMEKFYQTGAFIDQEHKDAYVETSLSIRTMEILQLFYVPLMLLSLMRSAYVIFGMFWKSKT